MLAQNFAIAKLCVNGYGDMGNGWNRNKWKQTDKAWGLEEIEVFFEFKFGVHRLGGSHAYVEFDAEAFR